MDINYFLEREQVERVRADRAANPAARTAHAELAERYRGEIDLYRRRLRAEAGLGAELGPPRL